MIEKCDIAKNCFPLPGLMNTIKLQYLNNSQLQAKICACV